MYKATRSFKVKGDDGNYRIVKPGDLVPEAATWPNVKSYLARNFICRADEEPDKKHYTSRVRPASPVKAEKKDVAPVEPSEDEPTEPVVEPTVEEPATEEAPLTKSALKAMSPNDLQDLAETMGLDPGLSKGKLIESILASA